MGEAILLVHKPARSLSKEDCSLYVLTCQDEPLLPECANGVSMTNQVFLDCPHCSASHAGMLIRSRAVNKNDHGIIFATCNRCTEPVSAIFKLSDNLSYFWKQSGGFDIVPDTENAVLLAVYPPVPKSVAPDHVDKGIAKIFIQALDARTRGQYHTAGMGLRKTLDIALKVYDPHLKGDLKPRIDSLADRHDLTPAMRDWAHQVRLLGNEAAHDHDEPTKADIEAMAAFTETLLKYLFTLPAEVEARRVKA
jgi:hypothetical protein